MWISAANTWMLDFGPQHIASEQTIYIKLSHNGLYIWVMKLTNDFVKEKHEFEILTLGAVAVFGADIEAVMIPAIPMGYEQAGCNDMKHQPRSPFTNNLVNERLTSITYEQIGVTQVPAEQTVYIVVTQWAGLITRKTKKISVFLQAVSNKQMKNLVEKKQNLKFSTFGNYKLCYCCDLNIYQLFCVLNIETQNLNSGLVEELIDEHLHLVVIMFLYLQSSGK